MAPNIDEDERTPLLLSNYSAPGNQKTRASHPNGDCRLTMKDDDAKSYYYNNNDDDDVITRGSQYKRLNCGSKDELRRFRIVFFTLGLHQTSPAIIVCSWALFIILTILVPLVNFSQVTCKYDRLHPFNKLVQISESGLASISFLCLSHNVWKHGLRKFLFLDQIERESRIIQLGYKKELKAAFWLLAWILLPCFIAKLIDEVWWFRYVSVEIPFLHGRSLNVILCIAVLLAWLYQTSLFLFVCVVFRLMCCLQILRFEGYGRMLEETAEVFLILKEHMCIRQQLSIISHRFRVFIISSLIAITASQFISLFMTTSSAGDLELLKAGDLVVCSVVQLTGFILCLHGAARITHRAQKIVATVSQWHALATCRSYVVSDSDSESLAVESHSSDVNGMFFSANEYGSDVESAADVCTIVPSTYEYVSFQKRQALVSYMQHANAGISLYGFVLDRGFLYAVFGLELSLVLFILGLNIGIN